MPTEHSVDDPGRQLPVTHTRRLLRDTTRRLLRDTLYYMVTISTIHGNTTTIHRIDDTSKQLPETPTHGDSSKRHIELCHAMTHA